MADTKPLHRQSVKSCRFLWNTPRHQGRRPIFEMVVGCVRSLGSHTNGLRHSGSKRNHAQRTQSIATSVSAFAVGKINGNWHLTVLTENARGNKACGETSALKAQSIQYAPRSLAGLPRPGYRLPTARFSLADGMFFFFFFFRFCCVN